MSTGLLAVGAERGGELAVQMGEFGLGVGEGELKFVAAPVGLTDKAQDFFVRGDRCGGGDGAGFHGDSAEQDDRAGSGFPTQSVVVASQQFHRGDVAADPHFTEGGAVRSSEGGEFFLGHSQICEPLLHEIDEAFGSFFGHGHSREAISALQVCPHWGFQWGQVSVLISKVVS